jgi:hypothetical protein
MSSTNHEAQTDTSSNRQIKLIAYELVKLNWEHKGTPAYQNPITKMRHVSLSNRPDQQMGQPMAESYRRRGT